MSGTLRLGVAQMTSTDEPGSNGKNVKAAYSRAVEAGAELIVFPENTLYFRIQSSVPMQPLELNGPLAAEIGQCVSEGGVPLLVTTPVAAVGGKAVNATVLFQPSQRPELLYTKIHLFDVDVKGAPPVRESDSFAPGQEPVVWEFKGWKFGLSVCYDLRFAELYSRYQQNVDVILVPSAFLVPTGEAHWHVLLRARAIENQCFVVAPAQAGDHVGHSGQVRKTYGHSLVVDPWGRVLADFEGGAEVRVLELHRDQIESVRRQIPMSGHRRLKTF